MKSFLYLLTLLLFIFSTPAKAQWERTKGPAYGGVVAMAFQSPYLFAATSTGLFRTADNGLNWEEVQGLPEFTIKGLAVKGNKVFAACWFYGLYVSNDFGNTWEKAGAEMPVGSKLGVDPTLPYYKLYATPDYIYCGIGGVNYKVYRSADDGKSWQLLLSNQYINDMIQDGDTILINNSTNTVRSIDNGLSFNLVSGLSPGVNNSVKLGKLNNTWVGALPNTSNPFRYSTNGGANFSNGTIPGPYPYTINNMVTAGNKIFISSSSGIYESTDGITWSLMVLPGFLTPNTSGYGVLFENNGDLWLGSYKFYLTQDLGQTFSIRNNGLTALSNLSRYNYNPADNFLYTSEVNNATLLRSSDRGDTWTAIGTGFASKGSTSRFIISNGATYFAGTDSGLYRSSDNANTWSKITSGLPSSTYSPNDMIKGNTELYLATTNSGVYKSLDSGLTWIAANNGFTTSTVSKLRWHQNKLYAGTPGGLFMSADSGISWTVLNNALSAIEKRVVDFTITQDTIITCFNYSKIYRSYDAGATWNLLTSGVNPTSNLPGEIRIIDTLYFFSNPTFNRGVYISSYSNNKWIPINAGLRMDTTTYCTQPKEMTHDADYLYLNGYVFGCFRLDLNNVLISGQLSGKVFWDKNSNGTQQANEPTLPDESLNADPNAIAMDTDTSGIYRFRYFGNTPTYTIQLQPKPYWIITSTPSPKIITPFGQTIDTLHFGVKMLPGITDMSASLNATMHRPGSRPNYFLVVKNNGTDTISDIATVTLDNNLNYLSGSTPQSINGNTLTFSYTNLKPGEAMQYIMNTELNSATPAGTVLNNSAVAYPLAGDSVPMNNYAYCYPLVQASFDPNNKTVEPTGNIGHQELLKYQINFQNTGNDTAFTVIIRDTISPFLDLNSFQFISASHPVTRTIKNGNVLEFRFDQILLPDSTTDEPNSHGLVQLSILPVAGLPMNTVIQNAAAIYFDYNVPVITNSTSNTITGFTGITDTPAAETLFSYVQPNPFDTEAILTIKTNETGNYYLTLTDVKGKTVSISTSNSPDIRIQRNKLNSGIYFYKVITPSGLITRGKLMVE
jgi:uncharacterized repeat protein (TIGR01451 family)